MTDMKLFVAETSRAIEMLIVEMLMKEEDAGPELGPRVSTSIAAMLIGHVAAVSTNPEEYYNVVLTMAKAMEASYRAEITKPKAIVLPTPNETQSITQKED